MLLLHFQRRLLATAPFRRTIDAHSRFIYFDDHFRHDITTNIDDTPFPLNSSLPPFGSPLYFPRAEFNKASSGPFYHDELISPSVSAPPDLFSPLLLLS